MMNPQNMMFYTDLIAFLIWAIITLFLLGLQTRESRIRQENDIPPKLVDLLLRSSIQLFLKVGFVSLLIVEDRMSVIRLIFGIGLTFVFLHLLANTPTVLFSENTDRDIFNRLTTREKWLIIAICLASVIALSWPILLMLKRMIERMAEKEIRDGKRKR